MAYCKELGFDGVVFNEHHYSAYGTMPSPNLIASALSQRTKKIKIGVLGNILPLRNHPVRVAEEYAMIDCLSGGRLIAGFVRGIPPEYIWYGVIRQSLVGASKKPMSSSLPYGPHRWGAMRKNFFSSKVLRSGRG